MQALEKELINETYTVLKNILKARDPKCKPGRSKMDALAEVLKLTPLVTPEELQQARGKLSSKLASIGKSASFGRR